MNTTAERLREALAYDPETGVFRWRRSGGNRRTGAIAGGPEQCGYWRIWFDGRRWKAHILAWLYIHDVLPRTELDHVNQIKADNRISNLREDPERQNNQNKDRPRRDNTSGFPGVCWCKRESKWLAQISVGGRRRHLGYFTTPEEASAAYFTAKRELHPFWKETTQ